MESTLTEVSVSVKLLREPNTPVNDAIPFMVDTRKPNKLERVLPRRNYEDKDAIPDWIKRPKANCLRFILAKDEEQGIYQDVECTYNSTSVLTFHGIKYNKPHSDRSCPSEKKHINIEYPSYNYGYEYIDKILKILDTAALDNSRITRYKGIAKMYISVPFDKDILADVIMNDHRLSNMMALCEKTSTLGNRRLFSVAISLSNYSDKHTEYSSNDASSYARVALAEKYVHDNINSDALEFRPSTEIIAMISKLPNEESLAYVAMSIKHAFDLYEIAYNDINYDNEEYVADNEGSFASKSSIAEGIKQLRRELPELFVNNYTRECPILPIMVSEEETRILRSQGFSVILYPKEDSRYSRYYTAPEGYYVGLKRNRLSNRNLFPCLVTCYLLDHMKREGSETYKYYSGVSADAFSDMHKQKLRPVPKAIALLYSNNHSDTSYYRKKAVSFISALEQATGSKIVGKKHGAFLSEYDLPLCPQVTRQEMWDKSDNEIMNIIMDSSCYGYGSSLYRYFEEMLKVSIHVVSIRDGTFEPLIPRHKGVYIWEAPYMEHVVIFETFKTTYGKTSCSYEYLVKVSRPTSGNGNGNRRNVEHHKFHSEDSMIRSILLQKYSESQKPQKAVFPSGVDAKEQLIDNFGKCREITMYDGSKIQTFTRPLTIAVTPEPTCFFDSHIRKMNKIKLEMGVDLTDLSKRSTTKIIYFPNDESLWYWM